MACLLCVVNHALFAIGLLDEKTFQRAPTAHPKESVNLVLSEERGAETLFLFLHSCGKDVLKVERRA